MNFDDNGKRVSGMIHKTHHEDSLHIALESKHDGISDSTMEVVLDMIHEDRVSDFNICLQKMRVALA